jgi:DNA-binding MarR family transcriptional regulator
MAAPLPEFDLERYLPYRFTVIAGKLSAELAKAYKVRFGISMPEWRVLVNVGYTEDLSVRDIERRVSLEKSKVSRAVTKLEAKGYLVKQTDTDDRRLLKLTLTDEGTQLLRALIPIAQALQDDLNAKLADAAPAVNEALDILMEPDE